MAEYQTPFFLFDLAKVRKRYERLSAAFPGASVFYAVKANNHKEVLGTIASAGSKFDIGSKHEAELILSLGIEPRDVVFSAPIKLQSHIRDTFNMGIDLFVMDSEEELAKLALLAPGSRVMVRLAVENEGSFFPLSMKFGAPPEHAASLLKDALELGLTPYGIAFHVGSQCTRKETWREAMEASADLMDALEDQGVLCEALDIGGGFPIKYDKDVPSIEEIAGEIFDVFERRFSPETKLILEPGRYLVGESAVLTSTVIGRARRGDEDWLFLDASAFHGLLEAQQVKGRFPYPVRTSRNGTARKKFVLSGPTCDPDDTILAEVWLPDLKIGDRVHILNTGAYSFVYATNFHGFSAPEIYFLSDEGSLEELWSAKPAPEVFQPEYDEEKRYVCEHAGEMGKVYFGIRNTPEAWFEPLWQLYDESLHMEEAVQEQSCYDRASFDDALVSSDYNKTILTVNGEPVGLLMGTNNMEKAKAAYINPAFLRKRFPREIEDGRFWYITCLFVSPRLRNFGFVRQMVIASIEAIRERDYVLALDVTDTRSFVPQILEKLAAEERLPIEKQLLGTQSYYAFKCVSDREHSEQVTDGAVTPARN